MLQAEKYLHRIWNLLGGSFGRDPNPADVHVPAANTAAVVTYPAVVNGYNIISGVAWSYSDDPTGGRLTISDGTNVILDIDITSSGPGFINFPIGKRSSRGAAMVIRLYAGGAGVSGKISILNQWTDILAE